MSLSKYEVYVKALLEGYEELNEKKHAGKWSLVDTLNDLDRAIELAKLTERQRQVVDLACRQGLTQDHVAHELGTSQPNVAIHLDAAVRKIANIYEQWEALKHV